MTLQPRYVGAILAAGRGSRMGETARRVPKPTMLVGDAPVIAHQVRAMEAVGIHTVFVVVAEGTKGVIRAAVEPHCPEMEIHYVEQTQALGSANAVGRLAGLFDDAFVLLLGDYYVEDSQQVLERMLAAAQGVGGSSTLAKDEPNARFLREACAIEADEDGRVIRIVEKPVRPATRLKGCGYYVLQPEFFDAVRCTPRTALRDEYELTHALDLFVQRGNPVAVVETDSRDTNLTRPADVLQCNLEWLKRRGLDSYVAPGVELPTGVRLDRCVIGSGVRIHDVTEMREVVAFAGSVRCGPSSIDRALLFEGELVPTDGTSTSGSAAS
ncbi:MAG: nucleotidyltransferase family protein [Nannocystaceae bacterium]|nr:nucleotidyltransferase family protein [Nannocystaceae bacterium]